MIIMTNLSFSKLWRVKEGKADIFRAWMAEMDGSRRDEALATFDYENVTREVFAMFRGGDGNDYVVAFNESNGPVGPSDPSVPINVEHKAIRNECLEAISDAGEVLLDLKK